MTRSERRYRFELAKERAKRTMRIWFGKTAPTDNPRIVAHNAETHCRPCNCFVCVGGYEPKERKKRIDCNGI